MISEWKKVKLSDVCFSAYSGGTPYRRNDEYYKNGLIPWLNTKEIIFNRIYKTENYITELGFKNSSAKWVPVNSVIIAMYGATAGRVAINKIPLTTNQACCNLIVDEKKADYRYIYYSIFFKNKELIGLANGSAQQNLNISKIKDLEINIPDLETQKKIAKILSSIDDKIELNQKINENLEQQAQAIFKNWFIDFEFPNEEGQPYKSSGGKMIWNEELQKEIPEGWKNGKLGDIAEINVGGDKPSNISYKKTDFFKYPIFSNGVKDDGLYGYTNEAKILNESVTISSRGTIGFIRLRYEPFYPIVRLISLIPKYNISAKYLYFSLMHVNIKSITTGTTQQQLTAPDLKKVNIIIPDMIIMNKFRYMQNSIFKVIKNNTLENDKLAVLRDTLLPRLMSGELDVSNIKLTCFDS